MVATAGSHREAILLTHDPISSSHADDDQTAVAYRSIRRMILDGGLLPNQRMSHRNLAEQLGLGRSPVRDAILQLEAEGFVVQRAQKGILLRELTVQEFAEIYELRLVMEPFFAERAALLATPLQVATMRESCEEFAAIAGHPDLADWIAAEENRRQLFKLDWQLHSAILAAAGNSVAARIFSSANVLSHTHVWSAAKDSPTVPLDRIAATAAEHMGIYEAIRERNQTAARERMRQHVLDAIPAVTADYARKAQADEEAALQAAAARAAAAVRRRT